MQALRTRTCTTFGCDCAQLNANRMLGLLEVLQAMPIPADPTKLLTTAAKRATSQTQPEVLLEVALRAVRQACDNRSRVNDVIELIGGHAPEAAMGPVACCSSMRVCSHAANSSSHAFTSDCRADERECITPVMSDWTCGSVEASGSSRPLSGWHFQHLRTVLCSYLSSSRSSTMASFFIFAGGSSSSLFTVDIQIRAMGELQLRGRTLLAEGLSLRFTFSVNPWPVFCT